MQAPVEGRYESMVHESNFGSHMTPYITYVEAVSHRTKVYIGGRCKYAHESISGVVHGRLSKFSTNVESDFLLPDDGSMILHGRGGSLLLQTTSLDSCACFSVKWSLGPSRHQVCLSL